jgi:hypothetical protein
LSCLVHSRAAIFSVSRTTTNYTISRSTNCIAAAVMFKMPENRAASSETQLQHARKSQLIGESRACSVMFRDVIFDRAVWERSEQETVRQI